MNSAIRQTILLMNLNECKIHSKMIYGLKTKPTLPSIKYEQAIEYLIFNTCVNCRKCSYANHPRVVFLFAGLWHSTQKWISPKPNSAEKCLSISQTALWCFAALKKTCKYKQCIQSAGIHRHNS